jgi:hypothetical protein
MIVTKDYQIAACEPPSTAISVPEPPNGMSKALMMGCWHAILGHASTRFRRARRLCRSRAVSVAGAAATLCLG